MRDTTFTGMLSGNPGDGRDLERMLGTEREVSAGTSGGGQRVWATSRWNYAPHPGELVGGQVQQRECNIIKW